MERRPEPRFDWFIPIDGDGAHIGTWRAERPPTFDYLRRVVETAEAEGYYSLLIPTRFANGLFGETAPLAETWTTVTALAAVTRRIRFLVAIRPGFISTGLFAQMAAALASLAAIFALLGTSANGAQRPPSHVILATVTILLSWAFIHTIFALHYAHEFYDETDGRGMAFPGGDPHPDYWDFVYFSFVIGMTSQVSDVAITSKVIRRTAFAHGVVSFLFNAALLALTVNIAAGAI